MTLTDLERRRQVVILFANKEIEDICTDDAKAKRALGAKSAKKLRRRLDDLAAASSLFDMATQAGRCHELIKDKRLKHHFAIALDGGYRLIFTPIDPVPCREDGRPEWTLITTITVVRAQDYHD